MPMESHSVIIPATLSGDFFAFTPVEAGTRFNDQEVMQDRVDREATYRA